MLSGRTVDEERARRMTVNDELYYDPYHPDIATNPYPTYARLRDEAPLYYNERYDFWALSRYADVEKALLEWSTFSNSRSDILERSNPISTCPRA